MVEQGQTKTMTTDHGFLNLIVSRRAFLNPVWLTDPIYLDDFCIVLGTADSNP